MMSIRLRFTLLYSAILALTLVIFGATLYSIQASKTLGDLKSDIIHSSEKLGSTVLRMAVVLDMTNPLPERTAPPMAFETFPGEDEFDGVQEREIARVLDSDGYLVASPFGRVDDALPLSTEGLAELKDSSAVWEIASVRGQRMLIYNRPVLVNDEFKYILQVARPLTERDRSLQVLGSTLALVSLAVVLIAFGIGWVFSGVILRPIQRITQTARSIGEERDFTQRVDYKGPQDEVGQLATTFNTMLERLQDA